ncbi:GFA family protein [Massilia sp. MS-15]|uniref:GFA family protein n=1 Tax=Massilia sp. MS-15 TaxID=2878200 RepID=UPI001CD1D7D0|nr:GFA family protein [Massilia sp. MS-15]MCA1246788.1 GFA family protein [Massilia sp. MS-15]
MHLEGGCFCGAVRYVVSGETFNSTLCHCSDCRRVSGAPALAWFSARRADFRFTKGEPARFASSAHVLRGFCPLCGTTLTFEDARWPEELDIASATLDDPEQVPPGDHTFVRSRLDWMRTDDGLPEYPSTRSAGR